MIVFFTLLLFSISEPMETVEVAVASWIYPLIYSWSFWILSIILASIFGYFGIESDLGLTGILAAIVAAFIVSIIIMSIF